MSDRARKTVVVVFLVIGLISSAVAVCGFWLAADIREKLEALMFAEPTILSNTLIRLWTKRLQTALVLAWSSVVLAVLSLAVSLGLWLRHRKSRA